MLSILTLATAVALSGVAAYFSVVGLIAIFAAAPISIAVMGGVLELAKLVTASWLYRNWDISPRSIKYYLTGSVVILSLITSMGIFGYLSKAHLDQAMPTGEVSAKLSIIDEKIKVERDNINDARAALIQLDQQVNQALTRGNSESGVDKSVNIRKQQARERAALAKQIETSQSAIARLNEERAPKAAELRKVEAEVGPIKYIAALIYGDDPEVNTLEKAVRWVIITLIFVFDPLAILLLIAANISLRNKPPEAPEEEINFLEPESKPESEEPIQKRTWNKVFYNRIKRDPSEVRIQRSKIHEIPKEIMDKVFRK
jgi:hypothetical protein